MQSHTEMKAARQSPFSFLAGFWGGLDAVAILFHGPSVFQPIRYAKRGCLGSDWRAVARDGDAAAAQMRQAAKNGW